MTKMGSDAPMLVVNVPLLNLPDVVMVKQSPLLDSGCVLDASYNSLVEELSPLSWGCKGNDSTAAATDECSIDSPAPSEPATLFQQLIDCGFFSVMPQPADSYQTDNDFVDNFDCFSTAIIAFTRQVLQCHLLHTVSLLNVVQRRCLQMFISVAFDMSRYLQV